MAGIVCMLVDEAVAGMDPGVAKAIIENLPAEALIKDSQPRMMTTQLLHGGREETLQLGRLMRSLYQQLRGVHDATKIYFGAVISDGNDKDFEQAMQLAKRIASDCMQDGNRRISCVQYRK